jgi:MarR family transcriptional regulator, organic hydroperoxide resistance regulator
VELAAAFDRLTRRAVALELPVLAAHDLTMWEYVVLSGLVGGPAQTQARLAGAVGRDKTRLIPILDALEARGLVTRAPDPADRRNKTVALTAPGRALRTAVARAISAVEDDVLRPLDVAERRTFRRLLGRLYEDSRPTIT